MKLMPIHLPHQKTKLLQVYSDVLAKTQEEVDGVKDTRSPDDGNSKGDDEKSKN